MNFAVFRLATSLTRPTHLGTRHVLDELIPNRTSSTSCPNEVDLELPESSAPETVGEGLVTNGDVSRMNLSVGLRIWGIVR